MVASECGRVLGVADGVGGWSAQGVDPGLFSKSLMQWVGEFAAFYPDQDPYFYLQRAWSKSHWLPGASTALVVTLDDSLRCRACNIGDSGMLVIRQGRPLLRSAPQTHCFNVPYQLGSLGDPISCAHQFEQQLQVGDTLVLASDGLWDNLFDEEIVAIVEQEKEEQLQKHRSQELAATERFLLLESHPHAHAGLHAIADRLATAAHAIAKKTTGVTPFAVASQGRFTGGRLDDTTVIVAQVEPY